MPSGCWQAGNSRAALLCFWGFPALTGRKLGRYLTWLSQVIPVLPQPQTLTTALHGDGNKRSP